MARSKQFSVVGFGHEESHLSAREKIRKCLNEIYRKTTILPENFGDSIEDELEKRFQEDGYEITEQTVINEMLWCYMCRMQ